MPVTTSLCVFCKILPFPPFFSLFKMVGGGNRRADGPPKPSISNGFAVLGNLGRKKKSDKEKGSSQVTERSKDATKEEKSPVYPAPARLTVKSWADVGDEDDDDYHATTSPPKAIWGKQEESETRDHVEESESEDELLDEGDDDLDEERDHEQEVQEQPEPIMRKPVEVSPAPKESERQLSKKEKRRKDLAEFEAILANFGVSLKEKVGEEPSKDVVKEIKDEGLNGDSKSKDPPPVESKSAKKKKRKDKARKEVIKSSDSPDGAEEAPETKQVKEDTSAAAAPKLKVQLMKPLSTKKKNKSKKEIDAAAKYCRLVAAFTSSSRLRGSSARRVRIYWVNCESLLYRKKKSNEEIEAAARAAAVEEAAARSAKLAAAKKKEKNHYNQQPTR